MPWASCITAYSLDFSTYKMGMMVLPFTELRQCGEPSVNASSRFL